MQADKSRDIEKLKERAKRFALPEPLSKEEVIPPPPLPLHAIAYSFMVLDPFLHTKSGNSFLLLRRSHKTLHHYWIFPQQL